MVFRKLADVEREKELAERRKDDPPLDLSTDLAVRKLLSRLQRRTENHRILTVSSQAEFQTDDVFAADEQTGNGISSNASASKPSAKLQFAKLLRGTVASVGTTSPTSSAVCTTAVTATSCTPPSLDSSPTGRPQSRGTIKPPPSGIRIGPT